MTWPGGARCAVMLTFDLDAESLWLNLDPENARRPGTLSQGAYAVRVAVPEILALLDRLGLPATFFVPGWVAERHPDAVRAIARAGHEVGHHGYLHEYVDPARPDEEERVLRLGLEILEGVAAERPVGYRSPAWETSANTLRLLERYGFSYSSNLMDDIRPYRLQVDGRPSDLVELPVQWLLDDAPYFLFGRGRTSRPIMPNALVLANWQEEFDGIALRQGLFNLTMHPQLIGRPSRLAMLERLVEYIRGRGGAWFGTGRQVADAWRAAHPVAEEGPDAGR